MASGSQPQQVNVADLDISQLSDVRKQLEEVLLVTSGDLNGTYWADFQELSQLSSSFAQLKQAQAKFKACVGNVVEVKPQNKGE